MTTHDHSDHCAQLTCREVVELLSRCLDSEVPQELVERARAHVRECSHCFRYEEQIRVLHEFCQKYLDEAIETDIGTGMPTDARERILANIKAATDTKGE